MLDFMSLIVNIQSILSEVNLQPPYQYIPGSFVCFTIKVNELCRVFVHLNQCSLRFLFSLQTRVRKRK